MNDGVCYEIEQLCSEMQHEHSFNQVSMFGNIKKNVAVNVLNDWILPKLKLA